MAASGTVGTVNIPPWATYLGLIVLLVASVIASYVLKIFPDALGNLGTAASVVGLFTFAAHDLEGENIPTGLPQYTTFVVLTLSTGAMAVIGSFTSQTLLEVGAFVTWVVLFLGFIWHAVANDAGANFSITQEAWVTAAIGVALSLLVWYESGAMNGVAGLVAVAVATIPMYFHLGSQSVTPIPPSQQPAPPAPPTAG
jgi:hypothetical protein